MSTFLLALKRFKTPTSFTYLVLLVLFTIMFKYWYPTPSLDHRAILNSPIFYNKNPSKSPSIFITGPLVPALPHSNAYPILCQDSVEVTQIRPKMESFKFSPMSATNLNMPIQHKLPDAAALRLPVVPYKGTNCFNRLANAHHCFLVTSPFCP